MLIAVCCSTRSQWRQKMDGYITPTWHFSAAALPFAHAFVAGLAGAQQMVITKSVSELVLLSGTSHACPCPPAADVSLP